MSTNINDTLLGIKTEEIQQDGKDSFHFHRYEPTPYEVLDQLFDTYKPSPDDVILDYGCGLGRLNFYLEYRYGIPSVGIEFSHDYYKRAKDNLLCYNGNRDHISFCHTKAEEYEVPVNVTICYFFNPFSPSVFRRVINRILDSLALCPRPLTLLLYYPEDETIFYLENHTAFQRIDEIAASDQIRHDRRERFVIYRI